MYTIAFDHFIIHLLYGMGIFCISAFLNHYMLKIRINAVPEARSNHKHITPKTGGIGIGAAFILGIIGFFFITQYTHISQKQFIILIFTSIFTVLFFIYDDFKNLKPWLKFSAQVFVAVTTILSDLYIQKITLPFLGTVDLSFFGPLLSILWIIFFMNVYNFMDGINGVASGSAMIGLFFIIIFSLIFNTHFVYICALILFFAILGFFIFNFPRGRLFLGDSGSQTIGFVIAVFALIAARYTDHQLSIFTIPMLFFTFIYDVGLTIIMRLKHGLNIFIPHRSFLFHILHRTGWPHTKVAALQYAMILFDSICVCLMLLSDDTLKLFFWIPILLRSVIYTFFVYALSKRKKITCYY